MRYIICPECGLNPINPDKEQMCTICAAKLAPIKLGKTVVSNFIKEPVRYNGKALFFVFQGAEYQTEFREEFICAPYEGKDGFVPHHWQRLEYVREGDIIFHGVGGYILAISIAKDSFYDAIRNGEKTRKIDCKYYILKTPLRLDNYKEEIIEYCTKYEYQPFNKNGTGNQGYLFDLCKELAKLFAEQIVKKNRCLESEGFIKDILEL